MPPLFKKAKKSFEFDILKQLEHHVSSTSQEHDLEIVNHNIPYLWTDDLAGCIAICLIYQNSSDQTIKLYHSVGEHTPPDEAQLKKILQSELKAYSWRNPERFQLMLHDFLEKIDDMKHLKIVMAYNKNTNFTLDSDERALKDSIENWLTLINKTRNNNQKILQHPINIEAFGVKSNNFFVNQDGKYGSLEDIINEASFTIVTMIKKKTSLSETDNKIISELDAIQNNSGVYQELSGLGCLIKGLDNIKSLASDALLSTKIKKTAEDEKVYLKIIAWDPCSKKPSKKMLDEWLAGTKYKIDQKNYQAIFSNTVEQNPRKNF